MHVGILASYVISKLIDPGESLGRKDSVVWSNVGKCQVLNILVQYREQHRSETCMHKTETVSMLRHRSVIFTFLQITSYSRIIVT